MGHVVGLGGVRASDGDGSLGRPPVKFEFSQRQSTFQDAGVVCGLDIFVKHVDEQWWLRSVQVVDTSAVGDEPELLELIHEVLESGVDDVVEFRLDQALDDPETIPVVCGWYVNRAPGVMRSRYAQISLKRPPGTTKV